jgi:hypothetical protein
MSGICSAVPDAVVAVGLMTRVEVPLGVTTKDFWAVGTGRQTTGDVPPKGPNGHPMYIYYGVKINC